MRISAVIIVKNESVMLPRCLESLKGIDEIIICDTGSTDNTIEVAKKYTDKVFTDYVWNDHFANARNHAKSKVTADWIISIDADEFLVDYSKVREACLLAEARNLFAVEIKCTKIENKDDYFYYPRLFKNAPNVFWEGAVHNTISVIGERVGDVEIKIDYSPAHRNDPDRAMRILKKTVENNPSPRMLYYLGREYWYRGDYENAVKTLGKYVQQSYFPAEKADAFLCMAKSYYAMQMNDDAKDAILQALKTNPNFKEACKFMADLCRKDRNANWESNVRQWELMVSGADNKNVLFTRKVE